jgi:hypothetical protein
VALKLIEHSSDADTCASIEAEMRGATLQARLADVDPRVVRVFGAGTWRASSTSPWSMSTGRTWRS